MNENIFLEHVRNEFELAAPDKFGELLDMIGSNDAEENRAEVIYPKYSARSTVVKISAAAAVLAFCFLAVRFNSDNNSFNRNENDRYVTVRNTAAITTSGITESAVTDTAVSEKYMTDTQAVTVYTTVFTAPEGTTVSSEEAITSDNNNAVTVQEEKTEHTERNEQPVTEITEYMTEAVTETVIVTEEYSATETYSETQNSVTEYEPTDIHVYLTENPLWTKRENDDYIFIDGKDHRYKIKNIDRYILVIKHDGDQSEKISLLNALDIGFVTAEDLVEAGLQYEEIYYLNE